MSARNQEKICSRGHVYIGSGPCPVCWPGRLKNASAAKTHVVLLRGVMPVGKNRVPMAKLREVLAEDGFGDVRTYIASGNALVDSSRPEKDVAQRVHDLIKTKIGPDLGVMVRSGKELEKVLEHNPFPDGAPNQVLVIFFTNPVPKDFLAGVSTTGREKVVVHGREVFVHYPDGAGRSKLKFPKIAKEGTMRNLNTIQKLIELAKSG